MRLLLLILGFILGLLIGLFVVKPCHAQTVDRVFEVQPGTVLMVTQNGRVIYARQVAPGTVHVRIDYLRPYGGLNRSRHLRYHRPRINR